METLEANKEKSMLRKTILYINLKLECDEKIDCFTLLRVVFVVEL